MGRGFLKSLDPGARSAGDEQLTWRCGPKMEGEVARIRDPKIERALLFRSSGSHD